MVENRLKALGDFMHIPVVGIVRDMTPGDFFEVLPVYYESGLRIIEITMNTKGAMDMIRRANIQFGDKMMIGAGTICTLPQLTTALDAGARFVVTPILDEDIITGCNENDIPVISGAFSPTEIFRAWETGAAMVKIFPATGLGVEYVRDIKAPLSHIEVMPTGGIDHKNAASFFRAGAAAVGIGSKLFDKAMIMEKNWNGLISHFASFVKAVTTTSISSFRTV